jgi:hypothetical protein
MYQRKFKDKILRQRDQIVSKNKETKTTITQSRKERKCTFEMQFCEPMSNLNV